MVFVLRWEVRHHLVLQHHEDNTFLRDHQTFHKSTLFKIGIISKSFSNAKYKFEIVCACILCAASTISKAPSQAAIERETSYEKSTCPGVSIRFKINFYHLCIYSIWIACDLIVIPRSRYKSILSNNCA